MWSRLTSLGGVGVGGKIVAILWVLVNRSVWKPQTSAIASIRDNPEHSPYYGKLSLYLP
jgi:hypothetical protein